MPNRASASPEKTWERIATPNKQGRIIRGALAICMAMGYTPDETAQLLTEIDDATADGLAYLYGGVPDGESVKAVGNVLQELKD
jgi:hypothetical protein